MRREELEHVVGAAANLVGEEAFVLIGSQAILGTVADPPETLLRSMEVDLFPRDSPEKAIQIDGSLGDGSQFHATFGYYAHGVGPETAKAPRGWQDRLVRLEVPPRPGSTHGAVAYCLEPHDLVLAKCVAGRDRDREFTRDAVISGLVDRPTLLARIKDLPADRARRESIRRQLESIDA